jgi:hypothetical protein
MASQGSNDFDGFGFVNGRIGRAAASLGLALCAACRDSPDDPGTASSSASTFTISAAPNPIRLSPGESGLSVVTIRGGQPPMAVVAGDVPNGVSVRVASTNDVSAFKLIITTDASVVPGTYAIWVRCTSSDARPPATTQVTLTVAGP